jgi:hypothetical protein
VPIERHGRRRWHPSDEIVVGEVPSLRVRVVIVLRRRRRMASVPSVTETIGWVRLAMPLRGRQLRAAMAMLPDQAEQPAARHRRIGSGVRIERGRVAHAHPLVGAFHIEEIVGVRPRRSPHRRRRRRRVEGGVVVRRRRRGRRVEVVGEGVGRERRRRGAEGEVGRGADGAEVAGWEAPWMVHEEVAVQGFGEEPTGRRRKEELRLASRKFEKVLWVSADGCAGWGRGEKPNREGQLLPGREDDLELVLFCAENTLKES